MIIRAVISKVDCSSRGMSLQFFLQIYSRNFLPLAELLHYKSSFMFHEAFLNEISYKRKKEMRNKNY
jgi:hypothetical protein